MKTGLLSLTRTTKNGDNGELSSDHKFVWEKIMTEYVKRETKLDDNFQKY